jgi:biopolymer transport protein ExbB/TolQ
MFRRGITFLLFIGGSILAIIFYITLTYGVKQGTIYDFFCKRGWYQPASMVFFFFGLLLITRRWWAFRTQEVLALEEMHIANRTFTAEEAHDLAERMPPKHRHTILGRRLAELLRGYGRQEEVGALVDRLAANDREDLERSASLLSWVRGLPPVLGLLGTLDGLRGGIAEISGMSNFQNLDELRIRLQSFANNSSTAFDTTLLGITCALILSAGDRKSVV